MAVIRLEWNPLQRDSNALFDPWLIELRRTKPSIKVVPRDRKLKGDCLLLAWLIVTITSVFSWGMFVWAEKMLWECFACVITCFYISAASQFCLFPFSTGNQQWVLRAQLCLFQKALLSKTGGTTRHNLTRGLTRRPDLFRFIAYFA